MSVRMKALASWYNKDQEGQVESGDEITVEDERAKELEMAGLATRLGSGGKQLTKQSAAKPTGTVSLNRPDEPSRPLTGAESASSSPQAGRVPRAKTSGRSKGARK